MLAAALVRFNRAPFWHRRVRIGPDRLSATSLDRLIYLWRWRCLGRHSAEAAFLGSRLKPGMHVIDAGANLGAYSHFFAHCVGPAGRVSSFEPDPRLFTALASNARDNGLAQIHPQRLALGESAGEARLNSNALNSGDNRLIPAEGAKGTGLGISVTTLDQFLQGAPADFVKMDIQGWEVHALRGMTQTLAANPRLQLYIELWPYGLLQAGSSSEELLQFLTRQGFRMEAGLGKTSLTALDFSALSRRSYWFTDIYAWRP
jgi:FkbM family methyltransferase